MIGNRVKVALVGAGNRGSQVYLPIITRMTEEMDLVGICDIHQERAQEQGRKYGVPAYKEVEELLDYEKPDILVVVVNPDQAPGVVKKGLERTLGVITETPLAPTLEECDELITLSEEKAVPLEVNENYYRVPTERIKGALLQSGLLGRVNMAFNDFRGHGYHGVSLLRYYIGFETPCLQVTGFYREFPIQRHHYRGSYPERERWTHGVLEFEGGACGVFDFTDIAYGSPLRWYNSTRFYAERGMAVGDEITLIDENSNRVPIPIERVVTTTRSGFETLAALVAHTHPPVVWENPLRHIPLSDGQISVASGLYHLIQAVREGGRPEYGAYNGRIDRQIDLLMLESARQGSKPIPVRR